MFEAATVLGGFRSRRCRFLYPTLAKSRPASGGEFQRGESIERHCKAFKGVVEVIYRVYKAYVRLHPW